MFLYYISTTHLFCRCTGLLITSSCRENWHCGWIFF